MANSIQFDGFLYSSIPNPGLADICSMTNTFRIDIYPISSICPRDERFESLATIKHDLGNERVRHPSLCCASLAGRIKNANELVQPRACVRACVYQDKRKLEVKVIGRIVYGESLKDGFGQVWSGWTNGTRISFA